jgi:hypothetical protein
VALLDVPGEVAKELPMGRFERARLGLEHAYAARRSPVLEVDGDGYGGQRTPGVRTSAGRADAGVPHGLRLAAAWAGRKLLLVAAFAVVFWIVGRLRLVLIPLSIALLLAAFLAPAVRRLRQWGRLAPSLATALVVVLTSRAMTVSGTAMEILAGGFLVLFATFFFLRDGNWIWRFVVRLLPIAAREPVGQAGEHAWLTLVAYVRATVPGDSPAVAPTPSGFPAR